MANINSIERDKKNIIKNFKPSEMDSYISALTTVLYESFLKKDFNKCFSIKKLIEEATEIYEAEGYSNSLAIELKIRLAKANEVLAETLDSKEKQEIELTKIIVDNSYYNDIVKVIHDKSILESLLASYEKAPSGELASAIKDVLHLVESNLVGIKFLLEEKEFTENTVYTEEVEILKEYYSSVEDLATKINSL